MPHQFPFRIVERKVACYAMKKAIYHCVAKK
jgi:hypothetical protein